MSVSKLDKTLSKKSPKKIGLVGCGRWGKYILRDLKALDCEVHVYTRGMPSSIENAKSGSADYIYTDYQNFLKQDFDGYIVVTPTNTHVSVIKDLLPANVPIFTEKPLCNNQNDAKELYIEAGDRIFVMDKWKYHSGIIKIKELIDTGEFGKLKQLQLQRVQWRIPYVDVDPIWILLPHDISIIQYITGETPKEIFTTGISKGDYVSSLYTVLETSSAQSIIDVSGDSAVTSRSISAICEKGTLYLSNAYAEEILINRDSQNFGAEPEKVRFTVNMPLYDEVARFIAYLDDSSINLMSTAKHAYENVKLISQLRNSVLNQ